MKEKVHYLESEGLRIVPDGIRFLVVAGNETVAEFKMLYEAENFILSKRKPGARSRYGSAAEFRSY